MQDKKIASIFRYLNITLLKIIKKLLKMRDFNSLLAKINFVSIKFNSDSNLKEEDIIH